jgi:hypothetical protein
MKLILTTIVLLTAPLWTNAQTELPEVFQKKLEQSKLVYVMPPNAVELPVVKNDLVKYDYAIKLKDKNVEIRYSIFPLPKEMYQNYENRTKKEGDSVLNPEIFYNTMSSYMFSQISQGKFPPSGIKLQKLSNTNVKRDFGADSGAMYIGPVGKKFSKDHSHGFFTVLHKGHTADIYVMYLFENMDEMSKLHQGVTSDDSIMKALRFK